MNMQETIGLLLSCYFHYIHPCIREELVVKRFSTWFAQSSCCSFTSFYGSFQCSKRWMLRSFTLNKCQHHSQPSVRRPKTFPKTLCKHSTHCKFASFHGIIFWDREIHSKWASKSCQGISWLSKSHSLAPTSSFPDTHFKLDGLVGF